MRCFKCGSNLEIGGKCTECGADIKTEEMLYAYTPEKKEIEQIKEVLSVKKQVMTVVNPRVYKVRLLNDGGNIVKVIRVYRKFTGELLKEAKDKINSVPCIVLKTTDYQKACQMAEEFRVFGASVEIVEE